jgi:hypothetical protein
MAGADARRLADEQAIRDLLHRYAPAIDRRDREMVRSCFVEDVEAEYGGHALARGVDSVLRLVAGAGGFDSAMHAAGTVAMTAPAEDTARPSTTPSPACCPARWAVTA